MVGMERHRAEMDDAGEIHAELRPLLFSIAYRMLGSVAEAEDVVQEAYLRWHRALTAGAEVAETEADVAQHAEMAESLSMAFLVLLESLSPVERAVFLLREVFEYGYDEIAQIVDKSEANCRQIFARARRHIEASRPRFEPSSGERDELARRFFAACEQGDMDGLLKLLTADVSFVGDGGGKAQAFPEPLAGRERIARLLLGLFTRAEQLGARVRPIQVNGQPGGIGLDAKGQVINVIALDIAEGRVRGIRSVVNPDKLGHLGPVSDVARLTRPKRR